MFVLIRGRNFLLEDWFKLLFFAPDQPPTPNTDLPLFQTITTICHHEARVQTLTLYLAGDRIYYTDA